ncbi:MAG: phosphate ABC transporter substrate-binding protein [Nitrospirae bacterium]|nr:MAG: phosphate ABC transporter substrate-binding protein [Nitrospirota bacterium]
MSNRLKKSVLYACLLFMTIASVHAADIGYQGTHILTHGALESLAKAFERKYGKQVFVKGGGCADGIAVVVKGQHEMGGLCCPLTEEKARKFNLIQYKVAVDIKAVMLHPKNRLSNLSLKQVSDIHNGRLTNWKQVGGPDKPIALVFRDHCRDMAEPVREALGIKGPVAKKAIIVKTDKEVVEYVEKFPGAIGIAPRVFAQEAKVKIISVDKIMPTPENTEKGLYPLTGDLYVITKSGPSGLTKTFIEFVLDKEGQAIIRKNFAGAK